MGAIFGKFSTDTVSTASAFGFDSRITQVANVDMYGAVFGIGGEYALSANGTAKFEYNYAAFFARTTTLAECVNGTLIVATCANILSAFGADKHLIKVGLNH